MKFKVKDNPIARKIKEWVGDEKIYTISFFKREITIKITAIDLEE